MRAAAAILSLLASSALGVAANCLS